MPEQNENLSILNGEYVEELTVNGHKASVEVAKRDAKGHEIDKFYLPTARAQEKLVAGKNIASINNISLITPTNFQIYTKDEVYTKSEIDYQLNSKLTLSAVSSLPSPMEARSNVLYLLTSDQSLYVYSSGLMIRVGISLPPTPIESGAYALMCNVSNDGTINYEWSTATFNPNQGGGSGGDTPDQPDTSRLVEIYIQSQPRKTVYELDEEFSTFGIVIKAVYSNSNSDIDVTSNVVFSEPDMSTAGDKIITCTYTDSNDDTAETTFTIKVNAPVEEIEDLDDGEDEHIIEFVGDGTKDGKSLTNESELEVDEDFSIDSYFSGYSVIATQSVAVGTTHGIKLGSGSKTGIINITFNNDDTVVRTIHVYAYKYGTDATTKIKLISNGIEQILPEESALEDSETNLKFSLGKVTNNITISTTTKRAYISKIVLTSGDPVE